MEIRKEKNKIKITFEYDPVLIQKIRLLPNRKFDDKDKAWYVPIENIIETVDILTQAGFKISYDIQKEYVNKKEEFKKIKRITKGIFNKKEKELLEQTKLPFFDFQKKGVGFLTVVKSGLLGDEPGLGKTIQSLGTSIINGCEKVLIICPSTLKHQWYEEIGKWLNDVTKIIIGGSKKQRQEQWNTQCQFYICNYELLSRDLEIMQQIEWDVIISDESTRISNPKTKQSKNIKKIKAKRRIAMTGTPLNNTVNDIWNIIDFCKPNTLGSYWQFTERYCIKDRWGTVIGYKNLPELRKKLKYHMIRRTKKEVLHDLPDKLYENIYIEFENEEKQIYNAIKNEIKEELKEYNINTVLDDNFLSIAIVKMIRLRQSTCSFELISNHKHSPKLDALKELLGDIMN